MRGHMVRRLWPEKAHDAIAQSSNILLQRPVEREYHLGNAVPEPLDTPTAFETRNAVPPWLSCTATANDQVRSGDGSISQARDLMNDNFAMSRMKSAGSASSPLVQYIDLPNQQLLNNLPTLRGGGRDHWLQQPAFSPAAASRAGAPSALPAGRLRHGRPRLVARPARQSGRYRGDHLCGGWHRMDHRPP